MKSRIYVSRFMAKVLISFAIILTPLISQSGTEGCRPIMMPKFDPSSIDKNDRELIELVRRGGRSHDSQRGLMNNFSIEDAAGILWLAKKYGLEGDAISTLMVKYSIRKHRERDFYEDDAIELSRTIVSLLDEKMGEI